MTRCPIDVKLLTDNIIELDEKIKKLSKEKRRLLHKIYTKRLYEKQNYGKIITPLPNLKSPCSCKSTCICPKPKPSIVCKVTP